MTDVSNQYRFGAFHIIDRNDNQVFDRGFDEVTNAAGQTLTGRNAQAALRRIRQSLGINTWQGLDLSQASAFLTALHQARDHSSKGYVMGTQMALNSAGAASRGTPLLLDRQEVKRLIKQSLVKGIPLKTRTAMEEARDGGNLYIVRQLLDFAVQYSSRLHSEFNEPITFSPQDSRTLLRRAFGLGIPAMCKRAQASSLKGDIETTKMYLNFLEDFQRDAHKEFGMAPAYSPKEIEGIRKQAYTLGIPKTYGVVSNDVADGQLEIGRIRLRRLKVYVQEARKQFGIAVQYDEQRAVRALQDGVKRFVKSCFANAEQAARLHDVPTTQNQLDLAFSMIKDFNQAIPASQSNRRLIFDGARADELRLCAQQRGSCP